MFSRVQSWAINRIRSTFISYIFDRNECTLALLRFLCEDSHTRLDYNTSDLSVSYSISCPLQLYFLSQWVANYNRGRPPDCSDVLYRLNCVLDSTLYSPSCSSKLCKGRSGLGPRCGRILTTAALRKGTGTAPLVHASVWRGGHVPTCLVAGVSLRAWK